MTAPVSRDGSPSGTGPEASRAQMLPPAVRGIRASFVFLTRIPVGGFPYRKSDWTWAAAHAPFVGIVLGAILGAIDRVLLPLGPLPAAVLALGASLLLTGAFHEDGLADTSDALGGAHDKARVLAILKDSRIGAFGGAALVFSLTARSVLLAQLGAGGLWAMPVVGCAARVGPIWLLAALPYVTSGPEAKSRELASGGTLQAAVATSWFAALMAIAIAMGCVSIVRAGWLAAVLFGVTALTGWRYMRRAGGITGDFLGATEQIGEIAALAVLAWRA